MIEARLPRFLALIPAANQHPAVQKCVATCKPPGAPPRWATLQQRPATSAAKPPPPSPRHHLTTPGDQVHHSGYIAVVRQNTCTGRDAALTSPTRRGSPGMLPGVRPHAAYRAVGPSQRTREALTTAKWHLCIPTHVRWAASESRAATIPSAACVRGL